MWNGQGQQMIRKFSNATLAQYCHAIRPSMPGTAATESASNAAQCRSTFKSRRLDQDRICFGDAKPVGRRRQQSAICAARTKEDAAVQSDASPQGWLEGLAAAQDRLQSAGASLGGVTAQCGLLAVTFGFLFQVTHNVGFLPIYDVWDFTLGPFPEAGTIPILLAPIWLLYGYVQPVLDEYFHGADDAGASSADRQGIESARERASSLTFVAACWATLAAQFLASDWLYQAGAPHWVCSATLAALALAIWRKFDNTKSGAILGALLTVGAPAGEMLIVNFLGLWHYTRPDLFGVPHWAGWCYATYAFGVGNVSRYLVERQRAR